MDGGSVITRILLVLSCILAVLVCYLYVDIWFYVQAQPPVASIAAPSVVADQTVPLFPDLGFQSVVKVKGIYTYEDMVDNLGALLKQYPLLSADIIGRSVEGRAIYLLKLGHGPQKILVDATHHANEWIGSFLMMTMVEHYAYYYHTGQMFDQYDLRQLCEQVTFYFVPMVNPDGVDIVANAGKNSQDYAQLVSYNGGSHDFSGWKANAHGVDLNRQYPTNWSLAEGYGPSSPAPANYAGPHPLSEPEIVAMDALHRSEGFSAQISFHTVGNAVYYFYHQTGAELSRDRALAQAVSIATGYQLRHSSGGIGGLERDYVVSTYKIPSLIVELGRNKRRPLLEYGDIWQRNRHVPLLVADHLLNLGP